MYIINDHVYTSILVGCLTFYSFFMLEPPERTYYEIWSNTPVIITLVLLQITLFLLHKLKPEANLTDLFCYHSGKKTHPIRYFTHVLLHYDYWSLFYNVEIELILGRDVERYFSSEDMILLLFIGVYGGIMFMEHSKTTDQGRIIGGNIVSATLMAAYSCLTFGVTFQMAGIPENSESHPNLQNLIFHFIMWSMDFVVLGSFLKYRCNNALAILGSMMPVYVASCLYITYLLSIKQFTFEDTDTYKPFLYTNELYFIFFVFFKLNSFIDRVFQTIIPYLVLWCTALLYFSSESHYCAEYPYLTLTIIVFYVCQNKMKVLEEKLKDIPKYSSCCLTNIIL